MRDWKVLMYVLLNVLDLRKHFISFFNKYPKKQVRASATMAVKMILFC